VRRRSCTERHASAITSDLHNKPYWEDVRI
jgi:hypothetical protein